MNSKRVIYFDYLRLFAVFAVVTLHVAASCWGKTDPRSLEWNVYNLYDGASRWGVPVFVMISGALFLGKQQSLERIYRVHILKMVVVFLFWSLLYAVWGYGVTGSIKTAKGFVEHVIVGRAHLWFLPMIVGLYMIVPFLNTIIEDRKSSIYFLVLSFCFSFFIPQCITITGLVFDDLSGAFSKLLSKSNLHFMIGFSGYYILGYLLHNAELNRKKAAYIYAAGSIGLLVTIAANAIVSIRMQKPSDMFYGNFTVNTLLVAMAVFTFSKRNLQVTPRNSKGAAMISYLSKCSFGVYLSHMFVIDILKEFLQLTTQSFNPLLSVPIISLLVYCSSFMLSFLMNKIPYVNRWLV